MLLFITILSRYISLPPPLIACLLVKIITVVLIGGKEFAYAKTFTNNKRISARDFTTCNENEFKQLLANINKQQN